MKKVLLVALFVITLSLTGCDQVESTITDLQDKVTDVKTDVTETIEDVQEVATSLEEAETTIEELTTTLETASAALEEQAVLIAALQEQNATLLEEVNLTNTKIKNALSRDNWAVRKTRYDDSWNPFEAEYCFGVFDEDWSTITASDYTHNTGLKFIITIEQVQWGTEVFAKDSCGNYSEFILDDSSYGLYSTPAGFFEVGETYEVVFYKEIYFTVSQLGLLPLADMGDFGAYPTDLSGIVSSKVE